MSKERIEKEAKLFGVIRRLVAQVGRRSHWKKIVAKLVVRMIIIEISKEKKLD